VSLLSSSYFGGHNSSNVARVSFTSVDTLYDTLNTSPVGWEGNNVPCLRCYPVTSVNTVAQVCLFFGEHTSCYVAHVFCTSVKALRVSLRKSVVLW
jgi:hypothetical protein